MTLPSSIFKVDETNALLSKVPGLGFSTSNLVKKVGGDSGKINPNTLQVENTNAAVAKIVGSGYVAESLNQPRRKKALIEASEEEEWEDEVESLIGNLWQTMNKITKYEVSKKLKDLYPKEYQKIVDAFKAVNSINQGEHTRRAKSGRPF